jgi:hypothetical protein
MCCLVGLDCASFFDLSNMGLLHSKTRIVIIAEFSEFLFFHDVVDTTLCTD